MAQTVLHKAESRGKADHGWLKSYHTFSFANYYNPERLHFGALRVLNDDSVAAGRGFGGHPHDNMEIISIPLEGELKHSDNMGTESVITTGEIQVMSAGTGVFHSEFNNSKENPVKFLQIWIFPNQRNVEPRYQQLRYNQAETHNQLLQILSPDKDDAGVWIHQQAWFHKGKLDKGVTVNYELKQDGNGIYIFVLNGDLKVGEQSLNSRDGYGIWDVKQITLNALSDADVLVIEAPMKIQ